VQARVNNSGNDMTKKIVDLTVFISNAVNDLKTSTNPDGFIYTIKYIDSNLKSWVGYQTNNYLDNMKIAAMIVAARSFKFTASMLARRLDDSHIVEAQKSLESLEKTIQSLPKPSGTSSGYSGMQCRCERCGFIII
jgi:hypothetical protein